MPYVRAELRRAQLVEVALRVLAREGVVGATTRRIAEEAGVPVGTVHYCFSDKDELLAAVVEHLADELVATAEGIPMPGDDLEAMLRRGLDLLWPVVGGDRGKQAVGFELTLTAMRAPRLARLARQKYAACTTAAEKFLRTVAAAVGLVLPDDETARLARWIVATVDGAVLQLVVTADEAAAFEVLDGLVAALATRIREVGTGVRTPPSDLPRQVLGGPVVPASS